MTRRSINWNSPSATDAVPPSPSIGRSGASNNTRKCVRLESTLTDARTKEILEGYLVPELKEGHPDQAVSLAVLQILESRLDNVVYRAGYAMSRDMARQLVKHGHFLVNGKKVDIPSYRVSEHDVVEVREKSRELTPFIVATAEAGSFPP